MRSRIATASRAVALISTTREWSDRIAELFRNRDIALSSYHISYPAGDGDDNALNTHSLSLAWRCADHIVTDAKAAHLMLHYHRAKVGFGVLYVLRIGAAPMRARAEELACTLNSRAGAYVLPETGYETWLQQRVAPGELPRGVIRTA